MHEIIPVPLSFPVPRIDNQLTELTKSKDRMTNGNISRLWTAVEKRASKAMMVTFLVAAVGFIGTLFALVYQTQNKVLEQASQVNTRVAVIEAQLENFKKLGNVKP